MKHRPWQEDSPEYREMDRGKAATGGKILLSVMVIFGVVALASYLVRLMFN